ncbi:4Fe-4S binding protein [Patescibacteria group bacterium]|nr:4Fe-4S binding protein [Patescibacteria group bacterium]
MSKFKQEILPGGMINQPGSSKDYKTGLWRTKRPVWDKDKCTQCGLCVNYCPENCIFFKKGKRGETNFDYCKGCLICERVCPVGAISSKQEEKF